MISMDPGAATPLDIDEPWRSLDGEQFVADSITITPCKKKKKAQEPPRSARRGKGVQVHAQVQGPEQTPIRPYKRSGRALGLDA